VKVLLPDKYCQEISERAVQIARTLAPRKTGAGAASLRPTRESGRVGIEVPDDFYYMMIQNKGMKPFNMTSLEGKVIPMKGPDGSTQFRTVKGAGRRKITTRNAKGQIINSKIAWRHPGLKPKNFLERGIYQATQRWISELTPTKLKEILMSSDLRVVIETLEAPRKTWRDQNRSSTGQWAGYR